MKTLLIFSLLTFGLNCFSAENKSTNRKPTASKHCVTEIQAADALGPDAFMEQADKVVDICENQLRNEGSSAQKVAVATVMGLCNMDIYDQTTMMGINSKKHCKLMAYSLGYIIRNNTNQK